MKARIGLLVGVGLAVGVVALGVLVANAASFGVAPDRLSVHNAAVTIPLSSPVLTQVASPGGNGGLTEVSTTATLSDGTSNATGSLTFKLWSDVNCSVQFGVASSIPVLGANEVEYESGRFVPMLAGTYRWTVDYSGDANNHPIIGECNAGNSLVEITVGPPTKLVFTEQPGGGTSMVAWTFQPVVTVQDAGGNAIDSSAAVINLAIGTNPNGGTLACTTTTRTAVAGIAGFSGCRIDRAASGYTLIASSPSLAAANSNPLSISVGVGSSLTFTQQPSGAHANSQWTDQPFVAVLDAGGNVVTASSNEISLAVGVNPAGGVLTCLTNPLVTTSGVAAFSGCSISKTGNGYTLVASSPGLSSAISLAFTITASPLSYVAVGSPSSATSNVTVAVNYPVGTAMNDLLVLVEINSTGGNTSTPTGWTLVANQSTNSPSKFGIKVWTRLSAGESSVNLAMKASAAGSTAWVARYTRSSGYPPNPTTATAAIRSGLGAPTASLTPTPDLTTSGPDATVISIVAIRSLNTLSLSTPQSFESRFTENHTPSGGQGVAMAIADSLQVAAPATPLSPSWSQSGTAAQWAWATIAWK